MPYDPTLFKGAAAHYRAGRPPYSAELERFFSDEVEMGGRYLDVGCGPGSLTVRLAPLFVDSIGLDPDADMLSAGRSAAAGLGGPRVRWVRATAEELPAAAPGPFRLVTFGQSFWWTDELPVAEIVYDLLEPGGQLALVSHTVEGRSAPPPAGTPIPHAEMTALVERYLGPNRRAGQGVRPRQTHGFEQLLASTRFGAARTVFLPGVPDLLRDRESVVAGYLSLSWAAPHLFAERLDAFVSEARELLDAASSTGLFWDWPGDTEIILAAKTGV